MKSYSSYFNVMEFVRSNNGGAGTLAREVGAAFPYYHRQEVDRVLHRLRTTGIVVAHKTKIEVEALNPNNSHLMQVNLYSWPPKAKEGAIKARNIQKVSEKSRELKVAKLKKERGVE